MNGSQPDTKRKRKNALRFGWYGKMCSRDDKVFREQIDRITSNINGNLRARKFKWRFFYDEILHVLNWKNNNNQIKSKTDIQTGSRQYPGNLQQQAWPK